jgi:hypothetical protein|tara:strand:+ start:1008 stop:1175 length:168 start_codon:yes stop_codon:yes gene_type:complete
MAKLTVRIPEPKEQYDFSNQKQINRSLTLMKEQLNSTFLDEIKQEQERFSWFLSG